MRKIIHTKLHIISRGRFYSSVFSSILIVPLLASSILPSCLVCFLASPINVSALTYSDATNVQFTFNSSLSVSVSGDLYIDELAPGTSSDSNIINVNVSTNNISGYSLSATTGSVSNATTNLTHTNNTNVFSSLTTNDSYSSFSDQNIAPNTWGYAYSIDNNTTWSNYSGLPVYTATGTTLKGSTSASSDTVNFKIAAKASSTQIAGNYSNIINFTAVTNKSPVSFYDAYKANNKEMYLGYYKLQDMSHNICEAIDVMGTNSASELIDIRDNQVYTVAKLYDERCWMIDNLSLGNTEDYPIVVDNLSSNNTNLELAINTEDYYDWNDPTIDTGRPTDYNMPKYKYISGIDPESQTLYGIYYNYCAASAETYCQEWGGATNAEYDLCPKNWRMPVGGENGEYKKLYDAGYDSAQKMHASIAENGAALAINGGSYYWTSTYFSNSDMYVLFINRSVVGPSDTGNRSYALSLRCISK